MSFLALGGREIEGSFAQHVLLIRQVLAGDTTDALSVHVRVGTVRTLAEPNIWHIQLLNVFGTSSLMLGLEDRLVSLASGYLL